jgi:PAS domain S-box-containing protein
MRGGADIDPTPLQRTAAASSLTTSLSESEVRYRSALKAGRMGSWETDFVARTRTWSAEGLALFGLALPDGRGQVGGDADEYELALHPDDRRLAEAYRRLADREDSFPADYRIVRSDGTVLWLSGRGLVVSRQADGRAHRMVSIMADVSERRHAEEHLRIERERLSLALEAGQMGAYDLDMTKDELWWSPQTYAVFGVDRGTFKPSRESVIDLVHPDDRAAFLRRRAEAIEQRRPFVAELRIVRSDGCVAWIGHRGHTTYDDTGRPVRHFGIAMDITERKATEQALRDADRQKDNFIATLAHELRNPLAPIRNAVSLLRLSPADDPQIAWCRDVIDRQVGQMTHLLEDLLDVSRLARGQVQLRLKTLAIATVIERAVEIARPAIDGGGHELKTVVPAEPLFVHGDLTRLAQVFSNLLVNAAKYTRERGLITLAAEARGSDVVVRVVDTGIGLSAGQVPQIFEMFGQLASALDRSQGGLGIGLSLARRLVEMHGGEIGAHSDGAGRGSEFTVRLPLTRDVPVAERVAAADAPTRAGPVWRVLIADDLADSADTLALLFEETGHDVRVAYDGEQALAIGESFRPDIALLDLGMPKLNGYEVCRRIRATPWGRDITLVAQTGWGQSEDRRRSQDAGFDHHLVKPIDVDKLMTLLSTMRTPPFPTLRSSERTL